MFIFYYESSLGLLYNSLQSPVESLGCFPDPACQSAPGPCSGEVTEHGECRERRKRVCGSALIPVSPQPKCLLGKRTALPWKGGPFSQQGAGVRPTRRAEGRAPSGRSLCPVSAARSSATLLQNQPCTSLVLSPTRMPRTPRLVPHIFIFPDWTLHMAPRPGAPAACHYQQHSQCLPSIASMARSSRFSSS